MRDCINTRCYGLNSLSYFGPKVWDMIPFEIREHQQKTSVTFSGFWPLMGWGGWSESVKKENW